MVVMKNGKHFRKSGKGLPRRIAALLCAAMIVIYMVPQGAFPTFAEEIVNNELAISVEDTNGTVSSPVEIGGDKAGSQDLTVSLNYNGASSVTLSSWKWKTEISYTGESAPVTATLSEQATVNAGDTLTLEAVDGQYGEAVVTVKAFEVKKLKDPAPSDPAEEADELLDGDKIATTEIHVQVSYQPTLTLSVKQDGQDISGEALNEIPYRSAITVEAVDSNLADLTIGGNYELSYSWVDDQGTSVTAEEDGKKFPCGAVGTYTVTASHKPKLGGVENQYITAPVDVSAVIKVVPATPEVTVSNFPELTYGEDLSQAGKTITVTSDVPGAFTTGTISLPLETAGADGKYTNTLNADGVLDTSSAGTKTLTYGFTPSSTGDYDKNYKTLSSETAEYSVSPKKITIDLNIVPGKNFDGDLEFESSAFVLADNQMDNAAGKIQYGFSGGTDLLDQDKSVDPSNPTRWTITGLDSKKLTYVYGENDSLNTNVKMDTTVGVAVAEGDYGIAIYSADSSGYVDSENYAVTLGSSASPVIKANSFEQNDVCSLPDPDYPNPYTAGALAWYQGENITVSPVPTYNTPDDPDSGVAGYAYTIATALDGPWNSGSDIEVKPGMDPAGENFHSTVIYAKNEDGLIGQITLSNIAVDNEGPSIELDTVKKDTGSPEEPGTGIDFAGKEVLYTFKVTDSENGSGVKIPGGVFAAVTDDATAPPSTWLPMTPVENSDGSCTFTVLADKKGYVWVKAQDNTGNWDLKDEDRSPIRTLVVEDNAPSVTISADNGVAAGAEGFGTMATTHVPVVSADDAPSIDDGNGGTTTPVYSGIYTITYELYPAENGTPSSSTPVYREIVMQNGLPTDFSQIDALKVGSVNGITLQNENQNDSSALLDGEYQLTVTAKDFCGNEGTASAVLKFDNTAPVIKEATMVNGNQDGGNWYYRKDNCGVTVVIQDTHSSLQAYSVKLTDENGGVVEKTLASSGTPTDRAEVEITAEEIQQGALSDGKVTLTVSASDTRGNEVTSIPAGNVTGMSQNPEAEGTFQFILDTTSPKVMAIQSTRPTGLKDGVPYAYDGGDYYHNSEVALNFTVKEANYAPLNFQYQKDSTNVGPTPVVSQGQEGGVQIASVTLSGDGKYSQMKLSGKDKAGNKLILSTNPAATYEAWDASVDNYEDSKAETGVVTMQCNRVIDTDHPEAVIIFSSTADPKVYPDEPIPEYYYKKAVNAEVQVTDGHALDLDKIWVEPVAPEGVDVSPLQSSSSPYTVKYGFSADGRYAMKAYGTDRAGNALKLVEKLEDGTVISQREEDAENYTPDYTIVIDTKSPKVTFQIKAPGAANTQLQTQYGNRYYLNSGFTAVFTVDEDNLDDSIQASYGQITSENYMSDSVSASTSFGSGNTFSFDSTSVNNQDGLYVFSITGHDRAGNDIELSGNATTDLGNNPLQTSGGSTFTSYVVVLDTQSPTLDVKIGNYYAASLTKDGYNVTANLPYRKEDRAEFRYASRDKSPVSVAYQLYSSISNPGPRKEGGSYSFQESGQYVVQGEQVFAIDSLSVTDLAGNKVEAAKSVDGRVSNLIYLDVTAPNKDQLAPTVQFVAHESGQGRSQAGVELYNGTVTVDAIITDPGFSNATGGKSSGLYAVYYEVLHRDSDDWTPMMSGRVRSGGIRSGAGAVYYSSGSEYKEVANEKLTGRDTLTFTFDAAEFNYNDISIRAWAEDNSGNLLGKNNVAVYRFGIDTAAPSIQVSYDNNDVQNGKYFKADRTATVVVRERNFDPEGTRISTTGAAIGGWAYAQGSSDNGDDDTWTCTVSYTTDGDYTFDVSSSDLVGHSAGEADYSGSAAPRDFTVDKTIPVINVEFDNNQVAHSIYYKEPRMATITIAEHNFEGSAAQVEMTAEIAEGETSAPGVSAWGSSGDENTATAYFDQDGSYTMDVTFTDLAGNQAEPVAVSEFVVDQTPPELQIGGVEDRHAYNDDVISPSISYHDINYDNASTGVSITGYHHPDGKNLPGTASDDAFGGSFICDNIQAVRDNDDVYTITGSVSDLAGNKTEATLVFSVNRFGSNYVLSQPTKSLTEKFYTNEPQTLEVTEINVNELENQKITTSLNGEISTLSEGSDYTIQTSNPGWVEANYTIQAENFQKEGPYVVTLSSEDKANNRNTNRSIKADGGETNSLPIEFHVDMTPPECIITGVAQDERYQALERNVVVRYDDNTSVGKMALYINDELIQEYGLEELNELEGEFSYLAKASNNWQELKVVLTDMADNTKEVSSGKYLLTPNLWVQYINNIPLLIGSIGAAALGVGAVILLFRRRHARR